MAASWKYRCTVLLTLLLCLIGSVASVYAYYVEHAKLNVPGYKALCDLSPKMSCSKVFVSKYGKGFGLLEYVVGRKHWINQPNSVFGLAFYAVLVTLSLNHTVSAATIQVLFCIVANLGSVWLAYILAYVLQDLCVVCVSMYLVNASLLLTSIIKLTIIRQRRPANKPNKKTN